MAASAGVVCAFLQQTGHLVLQVDEGLGDVEEPAVGAWVGLVGLAVEAGRGGTHGINFTESTGKMQ